MNRSEIGTMWIGRDESIVDPARIARTTAALMKGLTIMPVRAKVICNGIKGNAVSFSTVYEPDAAKDTENARFTTATPWGEIKLGIDNPAALEQFEPGKSYYVDFTPVE